MNPKEEKVYKETRLRNLKRRLAKLSTHPELVDEYLETQSLINEIE